MKSPLRLVTALATLAVAATAVLASMQQDAPAPAARFSTLAGESFTTSDLQGKVVLVTFWATDCPSCLAEMPKLGDVHRRYAGRGLETVAVAVKHDSPARVADYVKRRALPFRIAYDGTGEIAKSFGNIRVTPTTFVLDRQARVLTYYIGEPNWKELDRVVEKALALPA